MNNVIHLPAWRLGASLTARIACRACRVPGAHCDAHEDTSSVEAFDLLVALDMEEDRLGHSLSVGSRMGELVMGSSISPVEYSMLTATGILHDVGYLFPETRHHGIDGARWLRAHKFPTSVCSLVAWHSTSRHEAEIQGLADELGEFPRDASPDYAHALLWRADFTVDHAGDFVTVDERISSIRERHGADSVQVRALDAAADDMRRLFDLSAPSLADY